jgi:hypothetical protein
LSPVLVCLQLGAFQTHSRETSFPHLCLEALVKHPLPGRIS